MPRKERADSPTLALRHLKFGWWSLLVFLSVGILLEMMHGFKLGWYLDASNKMRRLMLTLGHAHGTLLSLVHIGFACSLKSFSDGSAKWNPWISPALMAASFLLPGGFLAGGLYIYDGDPGLGVFLVPVGAIFLLLGVLLTALRTNTIAPPPKTENRKKKSEK